MPCRRSLTTVLALATTLVPAAGLASAATPVTTKRAKASRVLAELRRLDVRLERSVEAYDLARLRLDANARALEANRRELAVARGNLVRARRRLADRLVYLYTSGGEPGTLEVLLGARSLGDLVDRVEAEHQVERQDAVVMREVRAFEQRVLRQRRTLRSEHERETELVAELASQRAAIESQLTERRQLLASIQGEIERLQAEERARQAELRRQAETRLAAGRAAPPAPPSPEPVVGVSAVTPDGVGLAPDSRHGHVVPIAMRYLGVPYRWGGASPETGFDCSGFVLFVYAQVGVSLPHNAAMQYQYGTPVAKEDLQPGDIVFFDDLGHDGIYIGGGQFIQAPRTGDVVKISSLAEPWYAAGYVGARRLP